VQVIFVALARARSLASFPFGKIGFEFLVRFTDIASYFISVERVCSASSYPTV
jgi:hypothetical protein